MFMNHSEEMVFSKNHKILANLIHWNSDGVASAYNFEYPIFQIEKKNSVSSWNRPELQKFFTNIESDALIFFNLQTLSILSNRKLLHIYFYKHEKLYRFSNLPNHKLLLNPLTIDRQPSIKMKTLVIKNANVIKTE